METSTLSGGTAILEGDTVVAECRLSLAVTHSERLLPAVDHVLQASGLRLADVDALAVSVGPGSFTGLRIGLSTMKGLAFATGMDLPSALAGGMVPHLLGDALKTVLAAALLPGLWLLVNRRSPDPHRL